MRDGWRVLDIGTGTGVAAIAAGKVGASVVGIDEAQGMLPRGQGRRRRVRLAAAEAIDLPFRDGSFDAVLANFVIAHFAKYKTALYDMLRVTRSERTPRRHGVGRRCRRPHAHLARARKESVVPREVLQPAMDERLPWRERFRQRAPLEEALMDAGVRQVRTETRRYRFTYTLDEYLEGMGTWATGRFVRSMLGEQFAAFLQARVVFAEQFADPVNDFREVLFASGTRPPTGQVEAPERRRVERRSCSPPPARPSGSTPR